MWKTPSLFYWFKHSTRKCPFIFFKARKECARMCTDFLCFFSRSWLRLCCPSKWSFVSCNSAVSRWVFFFSCWMLRWDSSLSSWSSLICTNKEKRQQNEQALAIWTCSRRQQVRKRQCCRTQQKFVAENNCHYRNQKLLQCFILPKWFKKYFEIPVNTDIYILKKILQHF